jgi:hypothetical protein
LRHTFAIQFYLGQRKAGVAEPWKLLQARLGHANLSTTMDTYVRLVDEFSETVTNAVVDFLAQMRADGKDCRHPSRKKSGSRFGQAPSATIVDLSLVAVAKNASVVWEKGIAGRSRI